MVVVLLATEAGGVMLWEDDVDLLDGMVGIGGASLSSKV